jgi:hypothetical protein
VWRLDSIAEYSSGLAEVSYEDDVGFVEFVLAPKRRVFQRERWPDHQRKRRACRERGLGGLAIGKVEEFNSAVPRKIQVQEVDFAASNVPGKTTRVNRNAGFIATMQWSFPDSRLAKFGVVKEATVNGFDRRDTLLETRK